MMYDYMISVKIETFHRSKFRPPLPIRMRIQFTLAASQMLDSIAQEVITMTLEINNKQ